MSGRAIGMIEVRGMLGAVEAADAAMKAAPVSLLRAKRVRGGLVTVFLAGDVASVRSAVDAATASLGRLGRPCSSHVIPNLSQDVLRMLVEGEGECAERSRALSMSGAPEPFEESAGNGDDEERTEEPLNFSWSGNPPELEKMTVMELRSLARNAGIGTMSKKRIRFAGKAELIRELASFFREPDRIVQFRTDMGVEKKGGESE